MIKQALEKLRLLEREHNLQQGMFSTKKDIDEISGAIKQLETLVWYIESNQYEV